MRALLFRKSVGQFFYADLCVPPERSAWSRHGPILEIGDATEEEALDFLNSQGVEARTAKQAYDLVGGRLVHLKFFVGAHHRASFEGMPLLLKDDYLLTRFTEVKRKQLGDARADVLRAQIMPSACYHELGSEIINALLDGQRLTEEGYYRRVGFGIENDLVENNVFALHVDSGVITFQSRLIEKYSEYARGKRRHQ